MPKARPKQPGFDVKRIKDPTYVDKYLDELYDKAKGAQDELTAISESVANATKGKPASRTDPKLRQRSMDKIRSNYDGDASRLTDLAGSKIIYETLDDLYNGLAKVEKELGGKIVYFEDRFLSPMESGYRDVQMNVRMANGHVAEFRLHLASIEAVSATEHAAYQVRRAVAPIAKEEGRAVSAAEKELEQALLDESQRLYEEALAKGMKAP